MGIWTRAKRQRLFRGCLALADLYLSVAYDVPSVGRRRFQQGMVLVGNVSQHFWTRVCFPQVLEGVVNGRSS
jgi:hypothetical protein